MPLPLLALLGGTIGRVAAGIGLREAAGAVGSKVAPNLLARIGGRVEAAAVDSQVSQAKVLKNSFGDIMAGKKSLVQETQKEDALQAQTNAQEANNEAVRQGVLTIGKFTGSLAAMGGIAYMTVGKIHSMGNALLEEQRVLGQFNGGIAQSLAQLDVDRMGRAIKSGAATEASTREFSKTQSDFEEALRPFTDLMKIVATKVLGAAELIVTKVIEPASVLLDRWLGTADQQQASDFGSFLADIRDGKFNPPPPDKINGRGR